MCINTHLDLDMVELYHIISNYHTHVRCKSLKVVKKLFFSLTFTSHMSVVIVRCTESQSIYTHKTKTNCMKVLNKLGVSVFQCTLFSYPSF